jgi:uncharacterized protein (UPF0276 family)
MRDRSEHRGLPSRVPPLGAGLGLRTVHYGHIFKHRPKVAWFEIISENFMGIESGAGGRPNEIIDKIRRDYPVAMHGVSLSIGSSDPLDKNYLKRLKNLAARIEPMWISDHLCWTGVEGQNLHDLLPLPYTRETITHLVGRIREVQWPDVERIQIKTCRALKFEPIWHRYEVFGRCENCQSKGAAKRGS